MATRSSMIDELVQTASNRTAETHLFYDDPKFAKRVDNSVQRLEQLLAYNTKLESAFTRLGKKVHGIEDLTALSGQFDGVYDVVD